MNSICTLNIYFHKQSEIRKTKENCSLDLKGCVYLINQIVLIKLLRYTRSYTMTGIMRNWEHGLPV